MKEDFKRSRSFIVKYELENASLTKQVEVAKAEMHKIKIVKEKQKEHFNKI